jgi:hypothetical protein
MAHIATKKYSYLAQAGILVGLTLAGLLVGQLISGAIMLPVVGTKGTPQELMDKLMVPENANLVRIMQFINVFFLFLMPAYGYAKICHRDPLQHLGIKKWINLNPLIFSVLLMLFAIPLVSALRDLTMHLPLGSFIKNEIAKSKVEYMKQALVMGTMRNFGEYFIALLIMAILPGLCEEIFFRATIQNLFTHWFKNPVTSILLTAFIFSAFHFEYSDFLGRFFLGIVLGWVYYQTGNIWYSVIMHAAFNGLSVTALYLASLSKEKLDAAATDDHFNLALTLAALVVFGLFAYVFYKDNKKRNNQPGKEILVEDPDNPFWTNNNYGN